MPERLHELTVLEETRAFAARIDQSPCDGCDGCGARCTTGVPMLRSEFEEIRAYVASAEGAEARRVERQGKRAPYPGQDPADPDAAFYTACRFRDVERGRCAVYPVRPLVCRLFGHVEWLPCPIERIPRRTGAGWEAIRRYGTGVQRTYEEWLALLEAERERGAATGG